MIHRLAGGVLVAAFLAGTASACPPPSDRLLFHSCWGAARLAVALLPEDLPIPGPGAAERRLVVTGSYTGRDSRGDGLPKPVGLFVHAGKVINPNLGRMDGVLIVDPATGQPELHHRRQVELGGRSFDLTALDQRQAFLATSSSQGVSALQSHLLVVDGEVDMRRQQDAPAFVRRMFFWDKFGFGLYQTRWPATLYDAAHQLVKALAPDMVLNLDMGSYDYCQRAGGGNELNCGVLDRGGTGKLSNLLILSLE